MNTPLSPQKDWDSSSHAGDLHSLQKYSPTSFLGKSWSMHITPNEKSLRAWNAQGVPEFLAQLLSARHITPQHANSYLNPQLKELCPHPLRLKNMGQAAKRITRALLNQETWAVFGDYDVDGATSSSLLVLFARALGLRDPIVYIPDRLKEGYGPNIQAFSKLAEQGCQLIVTVDCGATATEALAFAKTINLDVVVIDHHGMDNIPPAFTLVNPKQPGDTSGLEDLAAVGVTFLLLVAIRRLLDKFGFFKTRPKPALTQWLDIVAVGTICDVVPLRGLNRAFVRHGLKRLSSHPNLGLKALAHIAAIDTFKTPQQIGFVLGPHINAGGRVGSCFTGFRLLTATNEESAHEDARKLHFWNQERRTIESLLVEDICSSLDEGRETLDTPILFIYGNDWHLGVLGIVASRLVERYQKPCFVASCDTNGHLKGSARSLPGIDLGALVREAVRQNLLEGGGGHAMAAGFSLQRAQISRFKNYLSHPPFGANSPQTSLMFYDALLHPQGATLPLLDKIEAAGPYGAGNPTPLFLFPHVLLRDVTTLKEIHLRCRFETQGGPFFAMAFKSMGTKLAHGLLQHKGKYVDILGTLERHIWQNRESAQVLMVDARTSSLAPSAHYSGK